MEIKANVWGEYLSSKRLLRDDMWMMKATIVGSETAGIVAFEYKKTDN